MPGGDISLYSQCGTLVLDDCLVDNLQLVAGRDWLDAKDEYARITGDHNEDSDAFQYMYGIDVAPDSRAIMRGCYVLSLEVGLGLLYFIVEVYGRCLAVSTTAQACLRSSLT